MKTDRTNGLPYKEIFEWDVENWSKALGFWSKHLPDHFLEKKDLKVLALGERNGGLTLWLGLKGITVVSSDYNGVTEQGKEMHEKFGIRELVEYKTIDIFKIDYPDDYFDLVVCKSVIGGLKKQRNDRNTRTIENQKLAVEEIRRVLKPGGFFLGTENMKGSPLHLFFRTVLHKISDWRYLSSRDLSYYFEKYTDLCIKRYGFLGSFIKNIFLNKMAAKLDAIADPIIPDSLKYISFIVAKK